MERKKDIEEPVRYDGGILKVKVEDIPKEKQSRSIRECVQKADEPIPALCFSRLMPVTEMRVGKEKDL